MSTVDNTIMRFEDIEAMLNSGKLLAGWVKDSIQGASYDLRVGTIFRNGKIINGEHEERTRQFLIDPGEIISIFTLEEVNLPQDIAGIAFAMNSWSSEGLLVLNPGHIDPGYQGPLTVTAINLRKTTISISREQRIFTIMFYNIGSHTSHKYSGKLLERREKEKSFHARNQEIAPKSLSDLLRFAKDLPFVTKDQMDKAITSHWKARLHLILMAAAAIFAFLAVIK